MITRRDFIKIFWEKFVVWIEHYRLFLIIVLIFILQYWVGIFIKQHLAKKYKYTTSKDQWDESYIMYYKKLQVFEVIRFIALFGWLLYILAIYQSGFFSVFAIATWATILAFQTFILSFWVYFYLLMQYRVGDTIRVGAIGQWEIIYIEPFYTSIASKNNDGDHTGELIVIPNNQMWINPITKVKLLLNAYTKYMVRVVYDMKHTAYSFDEFVIQLEQFLDGYLPNLSRKAYNNYQSYRWFKYKLDFETGEYKDNRQLMYIDIWFLTIMKEAPSHKKSIISFVDSLYQEPVSENWSLDLK